MSARIVNVRPKPGFMMDSAGGIIPQRSNVIPMPLLRDGLANVMTGRGTTVDRRSYNEWFLNLMTPQQAESAYRDNWLARKIVDIPAKDMTREGRAWQAENPQIEALEKEEKRLKLWAKLLRCLTLARLYGGAALIPSIGDSNLEQPLALDSVKKQGLRFINVVNRHQLSHGNEILDPESDWFGHPEWFQITTKAGQQIKLHPSRVIAFVGQKVPEGSQFTQSDSWFWGDSVLQSINEAVKDATAAAGGFAALVDIAATDVFKIPELMEMVGDEEHEAKIMNWLALTVRGRSTHRGTLVDKDTDWEQRQLHWAGIPEVLMAFYELVAGAADIPVTRLMGQSPKGLQSTGKGEQQDYHSKVMADQNELLCPQLERVDELLIRSALGSRPENIYFEFNSLEQPDEAKDAEIEAKYAEILKKLNDTGLFDPEALAAIGKNRMIESGRYPGCEDAFEEHPDVPEEEAHPDDLKTAAELAAEKAKALRSVGDDKGVGQPAPRPFDDRHHYETQPRDPGGEGGGQWVEGGAANEGTKEENKTGLTKWNGDTKAAITSPNYDKPLALLQGEALENQDKLDATGKAIADDLSVRYFAPGIKTEASILRKVRDEGYKAPGYLTDISRATFPVSSPDEAQNVIDRLAASHRVYDRGWNKLPDSGYLDRKLYIQHPNGGVSEIIVIPKGVFEYKERGPGHKLYEISRDLTQPLDARKKALSEAAKGYAKAIGGTPFEDIGK